MSETDDTDELLVVSPNLYLFAPEPDHPEQAPYFHVVDALIQQVNRLRTRVTSIEDGVDEIVDDSTTDSSSVRSSANALRAGSMSGRRFHHSSEELPTGTTRQRPLPPNWSQHRRDPNDSPGKSVHFRSLPGTPAAGTERESVIRRLAAERSASAHKSYTQTTRNDRHKSGNASRNLSADFERNVGSKERNQTSTDPFQRAAKLTVEPLNGLSSGNESTLSTPSSTSKSSGQTAVYNHQYRPKPPRSLSLCNDETFNAAQQLYNNNRELLEDSQMLADNGAQLPTTAATEFPQPQSSAFNAMVDDAVNNRGKLMRLSDLWGAGNCNTNSPSRISNKLAEEELRRLHCEQQIQDLQRKILELQERNAVAVRVDASKNDAITKFQQLWVQVSARVQEIVDDRNTLEMNLYDLQTRSINDIDEANKKAMHYEAEASKALQLAHSQREKLVDVEKQLLEVEGKTSRQIEELELLEEKFKESSKKNNDLSKILGEKEIELNEVRKICLAANKQVTEIKHVLENTEIESRNVRSQYCDVEAVLQSKNETIHQLEDKLSALATELDHFKIIKFKNLEDELAQSKVKAGKQKEELRRFYQSQVEQVVQDKLAQFQKQLDQAESNLQRDLRSRERSIAETAAQHLQQLANKNTLEIKLLEEKHSQQEQLLRLQLRQAIDEQQQLRDRLRAQGATREQLAEQLHRVMESQWREAVRIINPATANHESTTSNDAELPMLNSRSRLNLEQMLNMNLNSDVRDGKTAGPTAHQHHVGSSQRYNDIFQTPTSSKDGGGTSSATATGQSTSRATTTTKHQQQPDIDLQRYVQILLNKHADLGTKKTEAGQSYSTSSTNSEFADNETQQFKADTISSTNGNTTHQRNAKRPWK